MLQNFKKTQKKHAADLHIYESSIALMISPDSSSEHSKQPLYQVYLHTVHNSLKWTILNEKGHGGYKVKNDDGMCTDNLG